MAELPEGLKMHPVLDAQHLELITQIERLRSGEEPDLDALWAHFIDHLKTEEQLMRESGYPGFQAHRDEHELSLMTLDRKRALYFMTRSPVHRLQLVEAVLHWFAHHVMYTDVLFATFLRLRNVTPK